MKGAALALLCAVALASAELNENGCPVNPYVDVLIPHQNCNKFYQCLQGDLLERKCASTLVFNVETQECDWPENVDCENRIPVAPDSSQEAEPEDSGNGNDDPSLAPEICAAEDSDGILVAHEQCNKFYQCHNGVPVAFACAPLNLVLNSGTEACDWPENVDCGNRVPGGDGDGGNGDGDNGDGGNGDSNGENSNSDSNSREDGGDSGNGNDDPSLAAEICAAEDSESVLVAHEQCNKFYICNNGVPVEQRCAPVDLVFNPSSGACDWPENVDCGNRVPGGDEDDGKGDGGNGDGGNGDGNGEDSNSGSNSREDGGGSGNGNGNDDPSLAAEICAAEDSDSVLVAHEQCNKFYICNNGVPVEQRCAPVELVFNPSSGACDWPENVDCSNRVPGGDGDGGNGDGGNGDGNGEDSNSGSNSREDGGGSGNGNGNDDPSLAAEICAAEDSESVLVAHEQCNKFYICNNGVSVEQRCAPVDLVFNPSSGACDWPENVDCGNRVPGGDGDGGNGDGDSGDGNGEDSNSGSNSREDGGGSGNGNGNDDPSLAAEICAAEDSDSVLVAHEQCNKFYICNNGVPVEQRCAPVELVFNPSSGACDWPENVDCSNRVPGGDGDGGNGDGDSGDGNGEDSNSGSNSREDEGGSGNGNGNDDLSLAAEICAAEDSDSVLVAHEQCNKFYICNNGVPVEQRCAPVDLVFNPSSGACDWPENVDCSNRVPGGDGDGGNGDGGNGDGGNGDGNGEDSNSGSNSREDGGGSGNGNGNDDPSLAAEICAAEDSESVLVAHEQCNKFYICNNGVPVEQRCAPVDLVFNPSSGACDWPENVDCGNRVPGGDGDGGNGDGDSGDGNGEDSNSGSNSREDGGGSGNGNGNDDPSLAAEICAAEDSDSVLVAHEQCNKFYICNNGVPVEQRCAPVDLVFNPSSGACDWPENVDCSNRVPGGDGDGGNGDGGNGDGGNGDGNGEDSNSGSNSREDGGGSGNGNGNDDPSLAAEICAAEDSESVLVAHEQCNKFYICNNGVPVEQRCAPVDLVFNPSSGACDWPENVDCGNRVPGGDGDGGNGDGDSGDGNSEDSNSGSNSREDGGDSGNGNGNDDPSLAAEICAAEDSDSVLVAHEQCNKFYICNNGVPVEQRCAPVDLVFNPSSGACDWPENVDCGNRVPGGDGDDGNGDGGNGDGNSEDSNSGSNSREDGGDSGNGNGNDDPSLAAEICAAEDSESVLVAHEQCNKFYICNNGVPVEQRCAPVDLVFNPSSGACDWAENVDCGNRVPGGDGDSGNGDSGNCGGNGDNDNGEDNNSSGGDSGNGGGDNVGGGNGDPGEAAGICAAEGSDGVLVAHENCNQFYKCSEGKPVAFTCYGNLLFNPNTDQCDWLENVECGGRNPDGGNGDNGNGDDGNGDNIGGGHGNPSEAPKICAAEGSDGVLVAHENCNQLYKCSDGKPVVFTCQPSLLFNPINDQCDWPENVDCGGRNPDGGNGDNGNAGNGDEGGDNANVGGGHGDPSKASEICAAEDSDSVLVAHENCNQFYVCSDGLSVTFDCPPFLVFNPAIDECDWADNVDCGTRYRHTSFNKHLRRLVEHFRAQ